MFNYVFGDTGGHFAQLHASLENIGVNVEEGVIPDNVRIIHLGDLIHKGPDSSKLLKTVDKLMSKNPSQWVQILGNHEFQHVEGSPYFWKCDCSFEDVDIINRWFDENDAAASFSLDAHKISTLELSRKPKMSIPDKSILFTHAGLTRQWWEGLGAPVDAFHASTLINNLPAYIVTAAGEMLGVKGNAGPVWAVGNSEVFNSWNDMNVTMPFIQFHGHTSSFRWSKEEWWRKDAGFKTFRSQSKVNTVTRSVITETAGSFIVGVDPGYSKHADTLFQPYTVFES